MRVMVAGSSGLIGKGVVASLKADGHDVVRLVRRPAAADDEITWQPGRDELDSALMSTVDVAINLCGVNIGDKRWNDDFKALLRSSRLVPTRTLCRAIAAAYPRPAVLLNASAIGYYGDRGDQVLTESSPPGNGFFADLCQAWESSTDAADEAGVRVVLMRNGLVLQKGDGLLGRLLPIFRLGIAGNLASGKQYMPCISLADTVGAIRFLINSDLAGPVNVVGPDPVTNAEFTKTLGALVHRPTMLPVPRFALRTIAGELANDALQSLRVMPAALTEAGYRFQHPTIEAALASALA